MSNVLARFGRSLFIWVMAILVLVFRPLRFLGSLLPAGIRETFRTWTPRMLWVPIKSFGRRVYVDEPCPFRGPQRLEPNAPSSPEFALSADDVRRFYEQGYLGPFRAITEDRAGDLRAKLQDLLLYHSPIYGFLTTRDRHLDSRDLMKVVCHPAVVERMRQLMGPDLLVWRSNIFEKRAGSPEITWHQGTTFLMEQVFKPALEPADADDFFEIGVWMAIDDANLVNGCMQVIPGSHGEIGTIRLTGTKQFLSARFEGDYKIAADQVVNLVCRPGEFYLFSERLIHGSEPNRSAHDRMSFVFRFVKPNCKVYRGERSHMVMTMRKRFPLDRFACVLVHGEDRYGYNKIIPAPSTSGAGNPADDPAFSASQNQVGSPVS